MKKSINHFVVSLLFLIALAFPFSHAQAADEDSVYGQSYLVFLINSEGGFGQDCFHFETNGSFYSDVGLTGTWSGTGVLWSANTLYGGYEVILLDGLSFASFILGNGESITENYTFKFIGVAGRCPNSVIYDNSGATYLQ